MLSEHLNWFLEHLGSSWDSLYGPVARPIIYIAYNLSIEAFTGFFYFIVSFAFLLPFLVVNRFFPLVGLLNFLDVLLLMWDWAQDWGGRFGRVFYRSW